MAERVTNATESDAIDISVPTDPDHIGAYVRAVRKERGVTLNALSERCEMPRSTLYRIESGVVSPSLCSLSRIADGLEMSLKIQLV